VYGRRSVWPAVLLSLLGAIALLVPISLVASNSLTPKTTVNQSTTQSSDTSQSVHPAQLYSPSPNNTPTPDIQQTPTTISPASTLSANTYSTIPAPSSSSLYIPPGSFNPNADSYLRGLYPNWGVCVGGSCSKYSQQ
jgi:cytoskeletal protein RodZ